MERFWMEVGMATIAMMIAYYFVVMNQWRSRAREIPGPTPLPLIGNFLHLLGPKPVHITFECLQQKYGPIMRLWLGSQRVVVISSPEIAKEIATVHDCLLSNRPKVQFFPRLDPKDEGFAFTRYGAEWEYKRKLCVRELLSPTRMNSFQDVMKNDLFQIGLQSILDSSSKGAPVKIREVIKHYVYSYMTRLMFSKGILDMGLVTDLENTFDEVLADVFTFGISEFFPFLKLLNLDGRTSKFAGKFKKFDEIWQRVVQDHQVDDLPTSGLCTRDFTYALMSAPERKTKNLSDMAIKNITIDLMMGSADPIGNTIEWALAELLRNPLIIRRAEEEINSVVGHDRLVHQSDVSMLSYIRNIVKETLRLHPIFPLVTRVAGQDLRLGGYDIPAETHVSIPAWSINRSETFWERPTDFDPGRFERTPKSVYGLQDFEYLPYGIGRRACPGLHYSMQSCVFGLAQMLHAFMWELPEGQKVEDIDMEQKSGLLGTKKVRLQLLAIPRLKSQVYRSYTLKVNNDNWQLGASKASCAAHH